MGVDSNEWLFACVHWLVRVCSPECDGIRIVASVANEEEEDAACDQTTGHHDAPNVSAIGCVDQE